MGVSPEPEDSRPDPALRDRVQRMVGVLRRAALARTRPVRHTRGYLGELALVDVADQSLVRRPHDAGDEFLRVPGEGALLGTFDALFDLHRLAADQPESVELVLAGGLLHAPGHEAGVRVHLLTRPVRLERDPATGEMVATLAGEATSWEDEELLGGTGLTDDVAQHRPEPPDSPLAPDLVDVLTAWADACLAVDHEVGDDWIGPTGPVTTGVRLVPAPTLVARRRGAGALRAFYDAVVADLADESRPVPVGLAQLVAAIEPADRAAWLARAGHGAAPVTDPLFPLPVGAAQSRILSRLGRDSGVVVEGPPGTGKTHTIANLLCALLAEGRRVLVTSEKAQALRVLRDKLPPEMRDLCVSLADPEGGVDGDLGASIAGLAARSTEFDPDEAERAIAELAARRDALLADRDRVLDALVTERSAETVVHRDVAAGFTGTRAEIARRVRAGRERDGWLAEVVGVEHDLPREPPLSTAELAELRALLAAETPRRRERTRQVLPPPVELPPESHVADLAETVGRGVDATSGDAGDLVAALGRLPAPAAAHLPPACRRVADAVAALEETGDDHDWARATVDAVLTGRAAHLWGRAVAGLSEVDTVLDHDRRAGPAQVRVSDEVDVAAAAPAFERFAAFLAAGGTTKRLFKPDEQKGVEPYLSAVQVHGADVATAAGAAAVGHHLRILAATDRLAGGFAPLGHPVRRAEHRALLVEQALALRATCLAVGAVLTGANGVRSVLAALPPDERPRVDSLARLELITTLTLDVHASRAAVLARSELDEVIERVQAGVKPERQAPELAQVLDALRRRDADGYADAVLAVDVAHDEARAQHRADQLADRLDEAAPGAVALLRAHAGEPWPDREERWPRAWGHACAAARLGAWGVDTAGPDAPDLSLADLDVELARTTARLAAARAWRACLTRVTAEQMRALQSHRASVAAVGRGTGRHADRYRAAAREAVEVARDAVPAWVMPIREVLSVVAPRPDAFDVVIVDEASQADLTSLFLLWLAPRVIVVGDDRQCSPAEVGTGALEPAFARLDVDLPDVPFYLRSQFTPRSSVFSVFRATFGPPIRLREHFRSMPEIVGWSSREFYEGPGEGSAVGAPLVPLRQFGADRLPPLRATFVPGASVRGSGSALANDAEATALVDAVVACADDPAYAGATFGVVVLQGHGQVDLVEAMLRERLAVDQWEARRLRVGIAADFQGDERDVVWLSLVVAPGHRLVSLTAERYCQAFNVAASRARDQMWLFHSVAASDLAEIDLRRRLLDHVTAASPDGSAGAPENRPAPAEVDRDRRHPAFGSLFAQRVFADLSELGFAVVPQVEVHGRMLDLVVTGASGRLAVVCDGDGEHRPVTRADVEAEHDLRRCGWPVVRVRASHYEMDPSTALTPVLEAAAAAGISPSAPTGPLAVIESAPSSDDQAAYRPRRGRAGRGVLGGAAIEGTVDGLVEDLAAQGFPPPRRDARVHDPRDGDVLTDAAALWPTGISRRALAPPVVLDPALDAPALERLRALGYQVFTSVDEVRAHVAASNGRG